MNQVNVNDFQCLDEFEDNAVKLLPDNVADYYRSGADEQYTLSENKKAFKRLRIKTSVLIDVTKRNTTTTVLGHKVRVPIGVSPTAMQKLAHPEGESAIARAVQSVGGVYTSATLATTSLEDVAKAAPDGLKWFQLYIYKDREITKRLVQRAEKAGYTAIVLTVDSNVFGKRRADNKNSFELPSNLSLENLKGEVEFSENTTGSSFLTLYCKKLLDEGISWSDIPWLKSITNLSIVMKGILTAEDAIKAADLGVAAVMVSNHGGRQLDTAPATIEALPEIAKAVGHRIEIYMDGGVRVGSDIFKAIALGAKMVFIGRPALWGLACNGENGVKKVLQILSDEFELTLGLTGCNTVADIKKEMIVHKSYYHKL